MKKILLLVSAAIIGVSFLAAPAKAQGVPQAVEITKVDVKTVAAGYRASKVIGSKVINDANQTIGKIDDLLAVSYTHLDVYKRQRLRPGTNAPIPLHR